MSKDFFKDFFERNFKKDKTMLYAVVAGLVLLILLGFLGVGRSGSGSIKAPKPGKNEYGFKSVFVDDTREEGKLKNFPQAKEKMLLAEKKILDNGLKIRRAVFSEFGMKGVFYLGTDENAYDSIVLDFGREDENSEWELFTATAKVFDDSIYDKVKKAMCEFEELSDEETALVNEIETTYKEDDIQTMKYYIDYAERTEKVAPNLDSSKYKDYEQYQKELEEKTKEVPYKELTFSKNEVEKEVSTTLYQAKRQENRPKADGIDFDNYGLACYIPKEFTSNPYNGMLYTWDYYTGDYVGMYPDGIDVNIKINGLKEGTTFDDYVRNDSRPAKSSGVTPFEIKKINGHDWYTCNNGRIYYYGAEFMGNTYEIEIKDGKTYHGITLQNTMEMLEKTLFFE